VNHSILIINDICTFPKGWLEMFIKDHIKYPKDAIAASNQYFFRKNAKITEFSECFKGSKIGIFNHITEMIFNFAIINMDLVGILYPKNFFQNSTFYNTELFNIDFDNYSSNCFLNRSNGLESNNNFINNVVCNFYNFSYMLDLHDYYYPYIKSKNSIFINIYNYRKYSTHIFKQFICHKYKYCFLKILSYDITKYNKYHVLINDKQYLCKTVKQNIFHNIKIPHILDLKCVRLKTINIYNKIYISGISQKLNISNETIDINAIPNQYIISRALVDYNKNNKKIIVIGKLINDLHKKI
jgi:hypothetical protein